jgi:uncharacterized membrane-anchored protein
MSRRRLILAALVACGLQTAVLATMITSSASILAEGQEIRLKTVPVDPRDLLRGEYVILNYEFTALESALIADPFPTEAGTVTLDVRLSPGEDGFWHPIAASFSPLEREEGTVVLRSLPFRYQPQAEKPAVVRADYGLERYYVPEGQGKALEEARNNRQIAVNVRVAEDGAARIASLEILEPGS